MKIPKDAFLIERRRKDRRINITQLFDQLNSRNGTHFTVKDFLENTETQDFISKLEEEVSIVSQGRNIWVTTTLFLRLLAWLGPSIYVVIRLQGLPNLPIKRLGGDGYEYSLHKLFSIN